MSLANRFISDIIYTLKRDYGQQVDLYIRGSVSQDPSTGKVTFNETKVKLYKVPVLAIHLLRKAIYGRDYLAASRAFTYGATFDTAQSGILIDVKDLPQGFSPKIDDSFVINHQKYQIKAFDVLEDNLALMYTLEQLKSQKTNEIYDIYDKCYLTEVLVGVKA